ncbi:MAG TPA: methyltransferase domain-containing protein [Pyrinomonadaceae bacterium]|nr:methyltransferase domain-containing protein [Pyrinomonadaceae bacterium]
MNDDLLRLAGIEDIAGFYRDRFYTGGVLEASYFDAIDRFDMKFARTMWIYDNVRRGSSLLDLGCGEGLLALLKRKDVYLAGIDLSPELVDMATRNGYDKACVGQLTELPFPDASFDYVVSLDVFGHVDFADKDALLAEIKRVLRPDGVTLHGIESLDAKLHPDYRTASPEKLAEFIAVDGHIGLESDDDIARRFAKFFSSVQTEPRYTLCLSAGELIKQYDNYGAAFDPDFIDYLKGLSFDQQHAFDMAMGYVFNRISDLHVKLPSSGLYVLVKASDAPAETFYNAHRDRSDLFSTTTDVPAELDRNSRAVFGNGWYPANYLPPIARWMTDRSWLRFNAKQFAKLRLQLTTHIPDLRTSPIELEFMLNEERICALCLFDYDWLELEIDIPASLTQQTTQFKLDISASRTWQPSAANPNSSDDRQLSIAVCKLQIS